MGNRQAQSGPPDDMSYGQAQSITTASEPLTTEQTISIGVLTTAFQGGDVFTEDHPEAMLKYVFGDQIQEDIRKCPFEAKAIANLSDDITQETMRAVRSFERCAQRHRPPIGVVLHKLHTESNGDPFLMALRPYRDDE